MYHMLATCTMQDRVFMCISQ